MATGLIKAEAVSSDAQTNAFESTMIAAEQDAATTAVETSDDFVASDPRWPHVLLGVASVIWIALVLWAAFSEGGVVTPRRVVETIALASGPLALAGIAWVLLMRTSRRESDRFARTSAALRLEVAMLESVIARIADRTDQHRQLISGQAAALSTLGESTEARLTEVGQTLREGTRMLGESAQQLDDAAESARTDIGVLLADLPRAEARARAMSEALREAGLGAHEQAGILDGLLATLTARGREADEVAGGAAQRLGAHLARIESVSEVAGRQMEEASAQMSGAVDAALSRAARAVDETRRALEDQSAAMLALVEQGEAAMGRVGLEASTGMSRRVADVGRQIEALSVSIAEQSRATDTLFSNVTRSLSDVETRSTVVAESGTARARALAAAIDELSGQLAQVLSDVDRGDTAATALIDRADSLVTILGACTTELDERLPASFGRIEEHATRAREATEAAAPHVAKLAAAAGSAAESLDGADSSIQRHQAALEALDARIVALKAPLEELDREMARIGGEAESLSNGAGVQLIDALIRVREAGAQAAEHAREAISGVIPQSADRLVAAAGEAMEAALTTRVEQQMQDIEVAATRAVEAAHKATDRLMRQMLTIAETTSSIEKRIAEAREEVKEADANSFSRRVALLVESLNSSAIDVTKILSNEVTDTAWAAYLKGDRGIFTRRAVRLLDAGEAREVTRHYDAEPEFREQVNRYISDFEAMLRDVLNNRDGTPLGVTLLSSDMGKLYVALAQAIERLR